MDPVSGPMKKEFMIVASMKFNGLNKLWNSNMVKDPKIGFKVYGIFGASVYITFSKQVGWLRASLYLRIGVSIQHPIKEVNKLKSQTLV